MVIECFSWVSHFWRKSGKGFGHLPDCILSDILSRLPVPSLLQCRMVCKHWNSLTSSSYFLALQNKRAPTVILVKFCDYTALNIDYYVYDAMTRKLKLVHLKYGVNLVGYQSIFMGSCGALLIMRTYPDKVEYLDNLINRKCLGGGLPKRRYLCGVFFHPLVNEHKFLWVTPLGCNRYKYYTHGSTSLTTREITSGSFPFSPCVWNYPIMVNLALHWMVCPDYVRKPGIDLCKNAVMVFKIDTEELYTLPHPGTRCDSRYSHNFMHLFVHNESLSLCHAQDLIGNMVIWSLEDYANWEWIKLYQIKVEIKVEISEHVEKSLLFSHHMKLDVWSVEKDLVLINWFLCGLYLVDLKRGTTERLEVAREKKSSLFEYTCVAYTSSLAGTPSIDSPALWRFGLT